MPWAPGIQKDCKIPNPMLIQIHILSNSRPWVWGLLSFGGDGELLERLHHDKDGQKKGKDFSIHGVKHPF